MMFGIPGPVGTILDLLVVIFGFGLIVFIHECGHFFAARWAGIRVLAFAMGFGPVLVSYRKGIGLVRGSSEPAFQKTVDHARHTGDLSALNAISPTEYRLSLLPLGGYVKMLGQEDLDPTATSSAPDSYQNCVPWKRMVVISAGVIMNILTAAVLFIAVFMIGLKVEPPVIGSVDPGSPAAQASPVESEIQTVGLQPGDIVAEINGRKPNTFADVRVGVAMISPDTPITLAIERAGSDSILHYEILPEVSPVDGLLSIGINAPMSLTLSEAIGPHGENLPESTGLKGLEPGSHIVLANNKPVTSPDQLDQVFSESRGSPVSIAFQLPDRDEQMIRTIAPRAELQVGFIPGSDQAELSVVEHLLGLVPVMRVADHPDALTDRGRKAGLMPGDIFARIAGAEFPSINEGIRRIRQNKGRDIEVVVLRQVGDSTRRITLTAPVSTDGRIGFAPDDTASVAAIVSLPPIEIRALGTDEFVQPPARQIITTPGVRIVRVGSEPVSSLFEVRNALQAATSDAAAESSGAQVSLTLELPIISEHKPQIQKQWDLSAEDVQELHALGWSAPFTAQVFEPEEVLLKASSPGQAIGFGLSETRRVLVTTYVTFARLFERTVKIEHLKGPVGIAHIGTLLAGRGIVWVMFFMAVISVNLAVINFLPLPIVDGGQFLMIVYEQIRGKPVPIAFQNAVTMAGLLLIVSLFLIVTFNDVRNLLGF